MDIGRRSVELELGGEVFILEIACAAAALILADCKGLALRVRLGVACCAAVREAAFTVDGKEGGGSALGWIGQIHAEPGCIEAVGVAWDENGGPEGDGKGEDT